MHREPTQGQADQLREFLAASGFSESGIQELLGSAVPPPLHALPKALYLTRDESLLNILLRLFFLHDPVPLRAVQSHLPDWLVELGFDIEILAADGESVVSSIALVPVGQFVFASDALILSYMDSADFVLPASSATALYMLDFTLRRPVNTTLDLGTGCGILAHFASEFSGRVVATDINPKATDYGVFNAKLNGRNNIDFRTGNLFEPVNDQRFDLILTNPPFVLAPTMEFAFRDNDMKLDEFCGMLAKTAPGYLEEGGCFQMICEWVETGDEPWHERLGRWFENSSCDVWVLHAAPESPEKYAQVRITESSDRSTVIDSAKYAEWMDYYCENDVCAIHSGIITMRRREEKNWIRIQALSPRVQGKVHEAIEDGILARDHLDALIDDNALRELTPRVSPNAQLEQMLKWSNDRWEQTQSGIHLTTGLHDEIHLDQGAVEFITLFDGNNTIAQAIQRLAQASGEDIDEAMTKYLPIVRAMIERGFLVLPALSDETTRH